MLGGFAHLGVLADREDFKQPWPNFKYANKELIPGLWYYDDTWDDNPDYWKKKIEALLQKRKQAREGQP